MTDIRTKLSFIRILNGLDHSELVALRELIDLRLSDAAGRPPPKRVPFDGRREPE